MDPDNYLEIHYFTTFFFILALSSFFFLGRVIKFIKSLHPFLKKHNALSRTISIIIIMAISRIIGIPIQDQLEEYVGRQLDYDEIDVLHSFFIGKTIAIFFLILIIIYFLK